MSKINSSKFDGVQRLLDKYTFIRDDESKNNDLICIICKNLLVDACQTVCGCQYCYKCISNHLLSGKNYCKGEKLECQEECLDLEKDVFRNVRLTAMISKVIVKCPNKFCQDKMEVNQVENHLIMCTKQVLQCPYASVGCKKETSTKDQILIHLSLENLFHTQLLISLIIKLKTELSDLQKIFESFQTEISLLRLDLKNQRMDLGLVKREMEFLTEESRNKDNMILIIDQEVKEIKKDIKLLMCMMKEESEKNETTVEIQSQEIEAIKKETEIMEWQNAKIQIIELKRDIFELRMEVENCNEDRDRRMNNLIKLNKLCPNIDMDFTWKIEDYSKKRRSVTDIYSDSFISHNYKLCLNIYIYGNNIGLWCVIMKGDKDDCLEWPLRRIVTLSIVDQETMAAYKSVSFQYDTYQRNKTAFARPNSEKNDYCIGTDSLVQYSKIKDISSILVNDSIVVSCFVR